MGLTIVPHGVSVKINELISVKGLEKCLASGRCYRALTKGKRRRGQGEGEGEGEEEEEKG